MLIVDDEKEIREGLSTVEWNELGIRAIGSASHGLEALQFISENSIDIVLTDIRMPFMDGIELMNLLVERYPFIKIVILSGYSDFSYAQKAVAMGAVDYLLKPTQLESLFQTFERLVSKMDAVKQEELRKAVLLRKEMILTKFLREEFIVQLLNNQISLDEMEQRASEGEVILDSSDYVVAVIRLDRISLQKEKYSEKNMKLITFSLDNILNDVWDKKEHGYHVVNPENAECYLLAKKEIPESEWVQVKREIRKVTGLLRSTISIAVGTGAQEVVNIHCSYDSASRLLVQTLEEDTIVHHKGNVDTEESASRSHINIPNYVFVDKKEDSVIIQKCKQYINNNFQRSITLKEVAAHVFVTPSHLSMLFRVSGESYIQYLTKQRMNKAVELLKDAKYKVYEIVEMTGYSDQTYFTEIFKKYTGKTPLEYRSKPD
ncbi:response regulator [Paenibacillus pectinilyticus]|uniref:response regulator n=1 Tax=Paenibacillus pectinilyticus TaxID=512399 RepID=UPI001428914D|nr:response regulator [Paenibacillus pectinilyticus]